MQSRLASILLRCLETAFFIFKCPALKNSVIRQGPNVVFQFESDENIYSDTQNLGLWARSEKIGCAVFIRRGMMEYWSDGILGSAEGYLLLAELHGSENKIKLFKAKFNYDPDYHNASGIADVAVYKNAIEQAGSLDREKVRAAIAATNLDTINGRVEFSDDGQIKGTSVVLQILGGEIYQVYPNGVKNPVYPFPTWKMRS